MYGHACVPFVAFDCDSLFFTLFLLLVGKGFGSAGKVYGCKKNPIREILRLKVVFVVQKYNCYIRECIKKKIIYT